MLGITESHRSKKGPHYFILPSKYGGNIDVSSHPVGSNCLSAMDKNRFRSKVHYTTMPKVSSVNFTLVATNMLYTTDTRLFYRIFDSNVIFHTKSHVTKHEF